MPSVKASPMDTSKKCCAAFHCRKIAKTDQLMPLILMVVMGSSKLLNNLVMTSRPMVRLVFMGVDLPKLQFCKHIDQMHVRIAFHGFVKWEHFVVYCWVRMTLLVYFLCVGALLRACWDHIISIHWSANTVVVVELCYAVRQSPHLLFAGSQQSSAWAIFSITPAPAHRDGEKRFVATCISRVKLAGKKHLV